MLPAKDSACCNPVCLKGRLPYTLTVTFSGLQDPTHSEHCGITATPCHSRCPGAVQARCMAPGGSYEETIEGVGGATFTQRVQIRGPLESVLLTSDGGHRGYARPGRMEPELRINATPGGGAEFTPTLTVSDSCGCPVWSLSSVSVTGGTGYANGSMLAISASPGDVVVKAATARLVTTINRREPEISASATGGGGTGAQLSVTLSQQEDPPVWVVSEVGVDEGGSGYAENTPVLFSIESGTTIGSSPAATAVSGRQEPVIASVYFWSASGQEVAGTGAEISLSLEQFEEDGQKFWRAASVTIEAPGSGYVVPNEGSSEEIFFDVFTEDAVFTTGVVRAVDETGGITSVELLDPGRGYKNTGVIESVKIENAGRIYFGVDDGVPTSVEVLEQGEYYRIDRESDYCATTFDVSQGCGGYGAILEPVVDVDPESQTVGAVTGISIVDGGENYSCWDWIDNECHTSRNGIPFVLRADDPEELLSVYVETECADCASGDIVQPVIRILPPWLRSEPGVRLWASGRGGTLTATVAEGEDDDGRPYWYISEVEASGGYAYIDGDEVSISFYYKDREYVSPYFYPQNVGTGTVRVVVPRVKIHATPYTPSTPDIGESSDAQFCCPRIPGGLPDEGGTLTGATILEPGKFWMSREWNGQPTPLYDLQLVSGGNGFARLARVEPVLTIGGVSAATFTPTFAKVEDESGCGRHYWIIESIAVSGGVGFRTVDYQSLTFYPATPDDVILEPARAYVLVRREEPVLKITVRGRKNQGSGGTVAVVFEQTASARPTWRIAGASITNAGSNYVPDAVRGGGAFVVIEPDTQEDFVVAAAELLLTVNSEGQLSSVTVSSPGEFFRDSEEPGSVVVTKPGRFYRGTRSAPPHVEALTFVINQDSPSAGAGAVISGEVETDTSSPNFGALKNVAFTEHGNAYIVYGGGTFYRGGCSVGVALNAPPVTLELLGKRKPIEVRIGQETFRTANELLDCDDIPSPAVAFHSTAGGTAAIGRGGVWDSRLADCRGPCEGDFQGTTCETFCNCCQEPFVVKLDGIGKSAMGWLGCRYLAVDPVRGDLLSPPKTVRYISTSHVSASGDVRWDNRVAFYCVPDDTLPLGYKWKISTSQTVLGCENPQGLPFVENYGLIQIWENYIEPDDDGWIPEGPIDKGQLVFTSVLGVNQVQPGEPMPPFCVVEQDIELECVHP